MEKAACLGWLQGKQCQRYGKGNLVSDDYGSPDKPRGLSIQPCKSEKEEPYIRYSSQGRSECLYLRIE